MFGVGQFEKSVRIKAAASVCDDDGCSLIASTT